MENIGIQQIQETHAHALQCIEKEQIEDAYHLFLEAIEMINSATDTNTDGHLISNVYSDFAIFLHAINEFDSCLAVIQNGQNHLSSDIVSRFVEQNFIDPNSSVFEDAFKHNWNLLQLGDPDREMAFKYRFLPTELDNIFYTYNTATQTVESRLDLGESAHALHAHVVDSFSDYTLIIDWNILNIQGELDAVQKNKAFTHLIIKTPDLFKAFLQVVHFDQSDLENMHVYFNQDEYLNHFRDASDFLPRNIKGSAEDIEWAHSALHQIHQRRLSLQHRSGKKPIVSICIPTYNRGHRAYENVLNCLDLPYDEEIEIIVSNNGTTNKTASHYDRIEALQDSRLIYKKQDANLGYALNLCAVTDMASGKFVMFLSDEDLLSLDKFERLLALCHKNADNLAEIRTSYNKQGRIGSTGLKAKGQEALLAFMMTSNYMSGLIFNRNLLVQTDVVNYIKSNQSNVACYYYPHMVMELYLAQYGDVLGIDEVFIDEGKAEKTDISVPQENKKSDKDIPSYATIDGRIRQLRGFYEVFKKLDIVQSNFDLQRTMLEKVISKTLHLTRVSYLYYYQKSLRTVVEIYFDVYQNCMACLDDFYAAYRPKRESLYIQDRYKIGLMTHNYMKRI